MKAVILAGGSGTRLWPVSRYGLPKQFMKLGGELSLLGRTIEMLLKTCAPEDIYVVTNEDYEFHVKDDLRSVAQELENNIILEPLSRNTAPAIALIIKYCLETLKCREDETILICPSDHILKPADKFAEYAERADRIARKGFIVTFGVVPARPETGYGYIRAGSVVTDSKNKSGNVGFRVDKFMEKPDLKTAKKYVNSGEYYWNSGMFAFNPKTMLRELKKHAPDIGKRMGKSLASFSEDFRSMPNISIDYAVMERSSAVAVIPLKLTWSDIGSWDSLKEISGSDASGNIKIGDVIDIDTKNSIIVGKDRLISTVGVQDLVVVDTEDALLVIKRGAAQKVKDMVSLLKSRKRPEVMEHITAYRPWGNYTLLDEGHRYKIKRIMVKPMRKTCIQRHHHRSEHWVVIKGLAKVMIDGKESLVHENESSYVPKSARHRLENPGKVPLELIEVQNGEYLGDDDIIRFDDVRGRNHGRRPVAASS